MGRTGIVRFGGPADQAGTGTGGGRRDQRDTLQGNPLYCWDVDPADFSYSDTRIVADVRAKSMDPRMVPLKVPFVDHCHLFDCTGDRQVITFRVIAARQVARTAESPEMTGEDWKKGGIHHAEIVYEGNPAPGWRF